MAKETEKETARQAAILKANQKAADEAKPAGDIEAAVDTPDPELPPEAEAARQAILQDTSDANTNDALVAGQKSKAEKAEDSIKKLRTIFLGFAPSAPNEHIIFGNGAGRFTLGDLRDLMAIVRPE